MPIPSDPKCENCGKKLFITKKKAMGKRPIVCGKCGKRGKDVISESTLKYIRIAFST